MGFATGYEIACIMKRLLLETPDPGPASLNNALIVLSALFEFHGRTHTCLVSSPSTQPLHHPPFASEAQQCFFLLIFCVCMAHRPSQRHSGRVCLAGWLAGLPYLALPCLDFAGRFVVHSARSWPFFLSFFLARARARG